MEKFEKLGLSQDFLDMIQEFKFDTPTEIQEKAIPLALQGSDVIGGSATGSGKTLAFGASIIENVQKGKGIQALILTPTRELAEQVSQAIKKFSKHKKLKVTSVYGGVSLVPQFENLKDSEIVIATPGRILDHISRDTVNLSKVKHLVLDEADRMLDMGFLPDVERIIESCPEERQTFLFSATISRDILGISKKYMNAPKEVSVKSQVDPSKLKQVFYDVRPNEKFSILVHLLKQEDSHLVMVFSNTKRNADFLAKNLKQQNINAMALHGDLSQNKRTKILEQFHKSEKFVLVCTDVAARGLDIKNVSHVYNYDSPKNSTDYVHRIGRTARAGKEGKAITIVASQDYENFQKVNHDPKIKIERQENPEFEMVEVSTPKRNPRFSGRKSDSRNSRGPNRRGNFRKSGSFRDRNKRSSNFKRRDSKFSGNSNSRFSSKRDSKGPRKSGFRNSQGPNSRKSSFKKRY